MIEQIYIMNIYNVYAIRQHQLGYPHFVLSVSSIVQISDRRL